ncbi:phage single-strand DNA binding protein [Furfurilactobacillus rossiae]|uniref:ERF family protein n=1 Tax=Furfurilactobacillus rossiae TaxID=231049 RepID=UPI0015BC2169|nr:ERF family protein [Furfurilactobacillus rossiae]QLE63987.1 phage single-strand DNA binding protein [Furfurilactobacillus rossiae]
MQQSDEITKLIIAMGKLQSNLEQPSKSKTAGKKGDSFTYNYADLTQVIAAIDKARDGTGITYLQNPHIDGGQVSVSTVIYHESGQFIQFDPVTLTTGTRPQDVGSALTYARRYSLQTAFGVAAEEDDDAQLANNDAPSQQQRPRRSQQSQRARPQHKQLTPEERQQRLRKDKVAAINAQFGLLKKVVGSDDEAKKLFLGVLGDSGIDSVTGMKTAEFKQLQDISDEITQVIKQSKENNNGQQLSIV